MQRFAASTAQSALGLLDEACHPPFLNAPDLELETFTHELIPLAFSSAAAIDHD
jgi:hypothetical protein